MPKVLGQKDLSTGLNGRLHDESIPEGDLILPASLDSIQDRRDIDVSTGNAENSPAVVFAEILGGHPKPATSRLPDSPANKKDAPDMNSGEFRPPCVIERYRTAQMAEITLRNIGTDQCRVLVLLYRLQK